MTLLPDSWFRPRACEFDGKLYEWCGVVPFKHLLTRVARPARGNPDNAYVLPGRSPAALRAFERKTRRSEAVHLLGLVSAAVLLAVAAAERSGTIGLAGGAVLALNFHCWALQRYNRIRICRVLDRAARRRDPAAVTPSTDLAATRAQRASRPRR